MPDGCNRLFSSVLTANRPTEPVAQSEGLSICTPANTKRLVSPSILVSKHLIKPVSVNEWTLPKLYEKVAVGLNSLPAA